MKIGRHDVQFQEALPLKIGDWKKLYVAGITPQTLAEMGKPDETGKPDLNIPMMSTLVLVAAQRVNKEITEADIDDMTLQDVLQAFIEIAKSEDANPNRPT